MTIQPRQPAGAPNGGQFSSAFIRPEAGPIDFRELISDDEHNEDGDYAHPPEVRSMTQLIAFWMTVPIPGAVMSQVNRAHLLDITTTGKKGKDRSRITGTVRTITESRSGSGIPQNMLRTVIRMTALYQEAGLLSQEEAFQLRNQQFTFDNGTTSTPAVLVEWFQMDRIIGSLAPGYINPVDQERAEFDASY
jgi:hypothetical protein